MSFPRSNARSPLEAPPGLPPRLIHPEDGGRVRALLAADSERLLLRPRCDACRRTLRPEDVHPATVAEAARWAPAPVATPRLATGQYL